MIPSGLPKRGDKEEKFTFTHSEKPISVDGLFCFFISVMEDGLHPTPDSSVKNVLTHKAWSAGSQWLFKSPSLLQRHLIVSNNR